MERRRPGQRADEKALANVPDGVARRMPTFSKAFLKVTNAGAREALNDEAGEKKTAKKLEKILARTGGTILHDVPAGAEKIDHVAVLPTGVFVIETRHWGGRVSLDADVILHGKDPHRLHEDVQRKVAVLAQLIPIEDVAPEGVICLVPKMGFELDGMISTDSTPVVTLDQLEDFVAGSRKAPREAVIGPELLGMLAATIKLGRPVKIQVKEDQPAPAPAAPTPVPGPIAAPPPATPAPAPRAPAPAATPAPAPAYVTQPAAPAYQPQAAAPAAPPVVPAYVPQAAAAPAPPPVAPPVQPPAAVPVAPAVQPPHAPVAPPVLPAYRPQAMVAAAELESADALPG